MELSAGTSETSLSSISISFRFPDWRTRMIWLISAYTKIYGTQTTRFGKRELKFQSLFVEFFSATVDRKEQYFTNYKFRQKLIDWLFSKSPDCVL